MTKDRRGVSIDPAVNEEIPDDGDFSGKVNEWARAFYINGRVDAVSAGLIDRMRGEIEDARDHMHAEVDAACDDMLAQLEAVDGVVSEEADVLEDALVRCAKMKYRDRTVDNPAIQHQSERAGVDPKTFLEELEEKYPTDRFGMPQEIPAQIESET